ncbi:MAG: ABC transporter permease [Chthonomonadales bacterium]
MNGVARVWADNPVLIRELRTRMRGSRAYWALAGYLVVLSSVLFLSYLGWWTSARVSGGFSEVGSLGVWFYQMLIGVQAFLVVFIAPAVTAASLTVEREQRTMDLLAVTPIPRVHIVMGKLLSAAGFLMLLLSASLPLVSLCFLLGGVDAGMVARDYLNLLLYGLDLAALALAWSSVARNTSAAIVYTYATLLAPLLVLGLILWLASTAMSGPSGGSTVVYTSVFVPLSTALPTLLGYLSGLAGTFGPPGALPIGQSLTFYGMAVPWWVLAIAMHGLVVATLAAVAAARLELYPERKACLLRSLVSALLWYVSALFFGLGGTGGTVAGTLAPGLRALPLMFFFPLGALLFFAPMFATGEIPLVRSRNLKRYFSEGWRWAGLKAGNVSSALPYLLLLLAGELLLFVVSGAFMASGATASRSLYGAASVGLQTTAACAAAIFGIWCIGILLSALVKNRWTSMLLLYGVTGLMAALPFAWQVKAMYTSSTPSSSPAAVLYYLNPLVVLLDAQTKGRLLQQLNLIPGNPPSWICCVLGWTVISIFALGFLPLVIERAGVATLRRGGKPPEPA